VRVEHCLRHAPWINSQRRLRRPPQTPAPRGLVVTRVQEAEAHRGAARRIERQVKASDHSYADTYKLSQNFQIFGPKLCGA
jgi:hypothetical protein